MHKITPNLWFDHQAEEAAQFYTSLFKNSKMGYIARYGKEGFEVHHQPEGTVMTVEFELEGLSFLALNGGPIFKFNPSISFVILCSTKEEVDTFWQALSQDGEVRMELSEYPFSEKYGWTDDKYGVSWQVMYAGDQPIKQKITPTLLFVGDVVGKAEEAMKLYTSVFKNSSIDQVMRYDESSPFDKPGTVMHATFTLEGQIFNAMDSGAEHKFGFNEAISFIVDCKDQAEIDYFWSKLGEGGDPNAQQCGWLKDKFGVSWQIVPTILNQMMKDSDPAKVARVTAAFLPMKKLVIADLEKAFAGN